MHETPDAPHMLTLSTRLYQALIFIYPSEFRRDFGDPMLQVFRDSSQRALRDSGASGLVSLWGRTMLDTVQTALEEHAQRGLDMSKSKYVKLSGWALMLAAVVMVVGSIIGGGETNFDDPLGGFDGFYEYSQLVLIPASLFLYTVGMIGLRIRYGGRSGWLGNTGLGIASISGGLSFLSSIPLFALIGDTWIGPWWNLTVYSILGMMVGLALFGLAALRTHPLPRWNALPILTSIWWPLLFLVGETIKLTGRNPDSIDGYFVIAMLFMFFGSFVLGYILQKDIQTPSSDTPLQA